MVLILFVKSQRRNNNKMTSLKTKLSLEEFVTENWQRFNQWPLIHNYSV